MYGSSHRALRWLAILGALVAGATLSASEPGDAGNDRVQKALMADVRRLPAERQRLLNEALAESPDLAAANWHSGKVLVDGTWLSASEAAAAIAGSSDSIEFVDQRNQALGSPRLELALARWARERNWTDREQLFLQRVVSLGEPRLAASAASRLGLVREGNQYFSAEDLKQYRRDGESLQRLERQWRPQIDAWLNDFQSTRATPREHVIQEIERVRDPQVISLFEAHLSSADDELAAAVVRMLAHIPDRAATLSLARHAIGLPWDGPVDLAVQELKSRSRYEYVPWLLSLLQVPIRTQYRIVTDARGSVRHEHAFMSEDQNARWVHHQQVDAISNLQRVPYLLRKQAGVLMPLRQSDPSLSLSDVANQWAMQRQLAEIQETAARRRIANTENSVVILNLAIDAANERIDYVLRKSLNEVQLRSPSEWWDWWTDYREVEGSYKPEYSTTDRHAYPFMCGDCPQIVGVMPSCFVAGTPVWTETGLRAIEQIEIGDRILSQDVETGELALKLVVNRTIRPASPLLGIQVGAKEVVATKGHLFWVDGRGWKMAKFLEPDEQLHSLRGGILISELQLRGEAEAYNLIVADFHSYFVGEEGLLVHDTSMAEPTRAITPGLTMSIASSQRPAARSTLPQSP